MGLLALGLVIFLGIHSIRVVDEDVRNKAIKRLGEGPWKGLYSLGSLIGFALIVWGFARARWDGPELWSAPIWARHTTTVLMLISMLLIGGYLFKKSHISVAVHHPMVWGVAVWAAAHLLANGSAPDLLLFGAFLLWAVADLASSYRRDGRNAMIYPAPEWRATIGAAFLGLILWGAFIGGLHLWLFGMSPLAT